ncbi:LAMI_0G03362g1_1 [Lachancea mirantina]|uniref:Thymidylate kinase n=1 Tax=Lachancea mirantina TaxID=1230905 RepID=A0A1G4K837_9SACH|nr:LAMI_0G03362g1_1 [Lachancea mirantina]
MGPRGRLILIEGLDRTGKSTQAELLACELGSNSVLLKFPDRTTPVGQLIDDYLKNRHNPLPDQAIHLLFSANRWEAARRIESALFAGKHVILDRYVYSGAAYSCAKNVPGMDMKWCLDPERGLIKPDFTIFFMNNGHESEQRAGFGDERYETVQFQDRVKHTFLELFETWENASYRENNMRFLNVANKSITEVALEVKQIAEKCIRQGQDEILRF